MVEFHDVLLKKIAAHSELDSDDIAALRRLPDTQRQFEAHTDIVRQGDKPNVSVVVLEGTVARYHTRPGGRQQYLSLHIAGDMPDAQTLFLDVMDHAVCAMDNASVSLIPHVAFLKLFKARPAAAEAIWRETLIDAAIFREAITNNSSRSHETRLAHFLCEQFYRARVAGLTKAGSCSLPLTQTEIGEALGMSLPSITRALQNLRETGFVDVRAGRLHIRNWNHLIKLGEFRPNYLHMRMA